MSLEILSPLNRLNITCSEKGLTKALTSKWTSWYLMQIDNGAYDDVIVGLQKMREDLNTKSESDNTDFVLITINPYHHIELPQLKLVVIKLLAKKWISTYIYTFEQRSESIDEFKGIHIHILLHKPNKKQHECKNEIRNTCKSICDISNPAILNFRNLKSEDDVKKSVNYLIGQKADTNKHQKQLIDIEFRKFHRLRPYYISDENNIFCIGNPTNGEEQQDSKVSFQENQFEENDIQN